MTRKQNNNTLLHACCAPCATVPLIRLGEKTTLFFYNPNIDPKEEFLSRKQDIQSLARAWGYDVIEGPYEREEWRKNVRGYENEPEGAARCRICYRMRLERTARTAKKKGFAKFATTLTLSPHKDAETINAIGDEVGRQEGIQYLSSNFKKRDGYPESIRLSKEHGLRRQDYCGCMFSRSMQSPSEKKR